MMLRRLSILFLLLLPCSAMPIGLSYGDGQIFPDGYVDFQQSGPLYMTAYPFAQLGVKSSLQTSYRQLYSIRELTDNKVAVMMRLGRVSFGLGLSSFGEPDYFHQLGLSGFGSFRIKSLSVGGSLLYHRISFDERFADVSLVAANIGASYSYDRILAYVVGRSINQPRFYDSSDPINPEGEIGLSLRSGDGLDSQIKAIFIKYHQPSAEILQSFELSKLASINWSLVLKPIRFGAGFALTHNQFGFEYKFSHHPVLGGTHTVSLLLF